MGLKKGSVVQYGKKLGIVTEIKDDGTFDLRLYGDIISKHYAINATEDEITKIIQE